MAELGAEARALLARVERLEAEASAVLDAPRTVRHEAQRHFQAVRAALVDAELQAMETGRIRAVTEGRLRLGALEKAGYRTVAQLVRAPAMALQMVPGVGQQTAIQAKAAAHQIAKAVEEGMQVRLDPDRRDGAQTTLLGAVYALERAEDATSRLGEAIEQFRSGTAPLVGEASRGGSKLKMLFAGGDRKRRTIEALASLEAWMASDFAQQLSRDLTFARASVANRVQDPAWLWDDYARRSVEYWGLLGELGDLELDVAKAEGYLPSDIADRVNQQQLDDSFLTVSLRGYQAFGAKFALVQRRVILGDEMGLGKTIEALAAIGHLRAMDLSHFLVVCPASVLINWLQEIERRTHRDLCAYRLHGLERHRVAKVWLERGGVAVTTFGTLSTLPLPSNVDNELSMLVVDEAHYVKNQRAKRSQAVRAWVGVADRVLFMTGTPMENKVEEFKTLVGYLQPEISNSLDGARGVAGPAVFRKAVAPAYLRRNQTDVLAELPERLEMEDWVEFGGADSDAYREAVVGGSFMAMRQAAYVPGTRTGSAKLDRLLEIVEESAANGWKVVVFSFFRGVLNAVSAAVGAAVVGQISGSVTPADRQAMVDDFTNIDGHSVLVSQIEAGGVGLNIQAGSVVILTEPQWKPSTEEQAIARCHRMGQIRRVRVHHLLATNSVDQRMLAVLRQKALLFDEYARPSDVAIASPSAVDITDVDTARRLAQMPTSEVEQELIRLERERLGVAGAADGAEP